MIDISTLIVKPEHSIIIKFDTNDYDVDSMQMYLKYLLSIYPNNNIILKPNGVELEIVKK